MAPSILINPTCAAEATVAPRSSPAIAMKSQRFITFPVKAHTNKKRSFSKHFRRPGSGTICQKWQGHRAMVSPPAQQQQAEAVGGKGNECRQSILAQSERPQEKWFG